MYSYRFSLKQNPPGLIDASVLRPDAMGFRKDADLYRAKISCGSSAVELGDLFHIIPLPPRGAPRFHIDGCARFIRIGAGLAEGTIEVTGDAGALVGAEMRGGEIRVTGSVGPLAGASMRGGRLVVEGDAGRRLGGPLPGGEGGMRGGRITVFGSAAEEAGLEQRGGLIAIRGTAGRCPGLRMRGGTLVVARGHLDEPGIAMEGGTLMSLQSTPDVPASFVSAGATSPVFWRLLVRDLVESTFLREEDLYDARFLSFDGDVLSGGRGEILFRQ